MAMDIARQHQLNIARKTMKMTPATARMLGGMTFAEAYELIYHKPLKARLLELIQEYGVSGPEVTWELSKCGWKPLDLLEAMDSGYPEYVIRGEYVVAMIEGGQADAFAVYSQALRAASVALDVLGRE